MSLALQKLVLASIKNIQELRDRHDSLPYAHRRHKYEILMHLLLGIHELRGGAGITRLCGYCGITYKVTKELLDALYDLGYVETIARQWKTKKTHIYKITDKGYMLLVNLEKLIRPLDELYRHIDDR